MAHFLKVFDRHTDYEDFVDGDTTFGDFDLPNVSYCKDNNGSHFTDALSYDIDIIVYYMVIPLGWLALA